MGKPGADGSASSTPAPREGPARRGLRTRLASALSDVAAEQPPASFALVMATGVVSTATAELGHPRLGYALSLVGIVAYAVLWLLLVARVIWHPRRVIDDLVDHVRGPGYFTIVAATAVLGRQVLALHAARGVAMVLGAVAAVLWLVVTYTVFTAFTVKRHKPSLAEGLTGAWLLAVVATQAVSVLAATLAPTLPQPGRLELNFAALSMWLFGGMLYIWMISLIFYRYTFFRLAPEDLTPPYWINMGAMAISTLGGAVLIQNSDAIASPFLDAALPFMKGFTVFFWATGTWWIPMLVILALWRHLVERFPLRYDPLYWGAVFPLGMYTLGTLHMAQVLGLDFLLVVPHAFWYVAVGAWAAAFFGLVRSSARRLRSMLRAP